MFFFRRPKLVLDMFTLHQNLIQSAPIEKSTKFFPEWWQKLPKNSVDMGGTFPIGTMKFCKGFLDYYRNSFTIPLWSDLAIIVNEDKQYSWQFADRVSIASQHPERQHEGFMPHTQYAQMKLVSPWYGRMKEKINWVWTSPAWNFIKPEQLIIPPGVVDFKYQCSTNINLFFSIEKPMNLIIPFGQPMVHITPMTEKNVEIRRHLVSKEEIDRISSIQNEVVFLNKYSTVSKNIEKFAKCPYTGGSNE